MPHLFKAMLNVLKAVRFLQPKADMKTPLLVTIGTSHFAEKARWCLDLSPLRNSYVEEMHTPAFHLSSTLALDHVPRVRTWEGGTEEGSEGFATSLERRHSRPKEKTGVPKLVLPSGLLASSPVTVETLTNKGHPLPASQTDTHRDSGSVVVQGGSTGTVRFLADMYPERLGHLFPAALEKQVLELDEYLDKELGTAATEWCFGCLLLTGQSYHCEDTSLSSRATTNLQSLGTVLRSLSAQDVPLVERILFSLLGRRVLVPLMVKANGITAAVREDARGRVHAVFERADDLIRMNNPALAAAHTLHSPVSATETREHSDSDSDSDSHSDSDSLPFPGFLLGTPQPTAVDITLAALAGPVLLPPQMTGLMPSLTELQSVISKAAESGSSGGEEVVGSVRLTDLALELREKYVSARLCLHMYAHHRHPGGSVAGVHPRTARFVAQGNS